MSGWVQVLENYGLWIDANDVSSLHINGSFFIIHMKSGLVKNIDCGTERKAIENIKKASANIKRARQKRVKLPIDLDGCLDGQTGVAN